jgi:acyl-CoA dehydrogenase
MTSAEASAAEAGAAEAGAAEAGAAEAGAAEAGAVEAGAVEAGAVEAGAVRAGASAEAGPGAGDLRLLRETLHAALGELSPPEEVRRQMTTEPGWEAALWRRLCRELGLAGLAVPEAYGGSGFGPAELGVAFEQAGSFLLCAPLLSTAGLAIPLLLALGDEHACRRYLPGLCDGALTATVAVTDGQNGQVHAVEHHGQWLLHGTAGHVVDGASADLILVPAAIGTSTGPTVGTSTGPTAGASTGATAGASTSVTVGARAGAGLGVFAVAAGSPGLAVTPLVTLDLTRKQARLAFDGTAATRVGPPDATRPARRALDVARALLAAEQAGGAARCLEMTVRHASTRIQFGRPIGSFQAVKQKAADMLIRVESARSAAAAATQAAALALGADPSAALPDLPELPVAAAVAQAYCSEAYVAVAADTIQLHGGIGFTWEHDAHLYFKRAWTSAELLGRPAEHYETIARHLAAP